jgi:O-glycosyl hydrolase
LGDPDANKVVDGIALHWYGDGNTLPSLLTEIHEKFPDKFLLYTEACILSPPVLGSWKDGNSYMHYIINVRILKYHYHKSSDLKQLGHWLCRLEHGFEPTRRP